MTDLTFVYSHNMVAYLEKLEDNADFAEIVDFLNASPIRYALTISLTVYVSYIEQFWSTTKIKTVNNEMQIRAKVDGKTIVITDVSIRKDLHFNHEDGSGPRRQDTILGDRPAQTRLTERVLALENIKTTQNLEITNLKKRVKKLEKKTKGCIQTGENEIDQDEGISWFQEDVETQGRYGHDIEINTASTSITTASINITTVEPVTTASVLITTAGVSVSTAEPSTPPTITILIKNKNLTIAQTLMKMRSVKSKEKSKEQEVSSETATTTTR
ncbi:hypothetical protein Tco_0337536 [Tanacetum coccineum]